MIVFDFLVVSDLKLARI